MYKCKICGKKYTDLSSLYNHIEQQHSEMIPMDMSIQQYYYYMKTGRSNGNCVMCKQPTTWNKNTNKYNRFCGDPKCKEEYVKIAKSRMIAKYGKVHLLNDPKKQREMLANRKISGVYRWSNSKIETTYTGSYELDFLKTLDLFFEWDPEDISMPSPHTYTYKYDGEEKFYIPDVFIHSLDLEIEIKDGGDNPNNHHKIQAVDKEKERLKDETMTSQKLFHYVKITNKNYTNFFDFLKEAKDGFEKYGDDKKIPRIFKIEDIRTKGNIKPVQESSEEIDKFDGNTIETPECLLEMDLLKDIINNLQMKDKSLKKKDFFIQASYNARKNSPKDLQEYMSMLVNSIQSDKDIVYVKRLIGDSKTYYRNLLNKGHKKIEGYDDYIRWVQYDLDKEIEKRMEKVKKQQSKLFESEIIDINDSFNDDESIVTNVFQINVCCNKPRNAFSMNDLDSFIEIGKYVLNKTTVGIKYNLVNKSVHDTNSNNSCDCYQLTFNDNMSLDELISNKCSDDISIFNLYKTNDPEYKFINEVCLKLLGVKPESIELL